MRHRAHDEDDAGDRVEDCRVAESGGGDVSRKDRNVCSVADDDDQEGCAVIDHAE